MANHAVHISNEVWAQFPQVINSVKNLGDFLINREQCERLLVFYNRLGQLLKVKNRDGITMEDYRRSKENEVELLCCPDFNGDMFLNILQKGKQLLESCTIKNWFATMKTAGVNQASYVAFHNELGAGIRSTFAYGIEGMLAVLLYDAMISPIYFLNEIDVIALLNRDARRDMLHMLHMLENPEYVADDSCIVRSTIFRMPRKERVPVILSLVSQNLQDDMLGGTKSVMEEILRTVKSEELPSHLRIAYEDIEFIEEIGAGAAAYIWKCRWLHSEHPVKIFKHSDDVDSLRAEVEKLIELRHPNIVALVGFSDCGFHERPMIVMELLDCDLCTLIRTGDYEMPAKLTTLRWNKLFKWPRQHNEFSIGEAIDFIYQIATGMAFLHMRKILHGVLKALNVLVKRLHDRIELKISDFGISQKLVKNPDHDHSGSDSDYSSFNTANAGTPRWMAPEVFGATGEQLLKLSYSLKADVYSFSMTCVEILTRQVPFSDKESWEIKGLVERGERPKLPNDLPEDLCELIVQCWDQEPTNRPDFSEICERMQPLKRRYPR